MSLAKLVLFVVLMSLVGAPLAGQQTSAPDLEQLEQQALYLAAESVAGSVVRIETVGGLEKVGDVLVNMGPTSGVVVNPDGFIISSAFNFIQKPSSILVQLPGGKRKAAEIVSEDHSRGLVLLKVDVDDPLPVADFSDKNEVAVGQWAVTVGRTLPVDGFNMTVGIVSAKDRVWGKAIQTDANVSPANYGGALVDIRGRVVGILVPMSPDSTDVVAGAEWYDSGIGFAVPMSDVMANLDRLKESELYSGKMGVSMKSKDLYGDEPIVGVTRPKSPARDAGLTADDRVTAINGHKVDSHSQMKHVLGPLLAGETIRVAYRRGDESLSSDLVLIDKLEPYEHAFLGILPMRESLVKKVDGEAGEVESEAADTEDPAVGGVSVRYVFPDSPAAKLGIKANDVITQFNDLPANDLAALRNAISAVEPGDDVQLTWMTEGTEEPNDSTVTLAAMPTAVPEMLPDVLPKVDELNEDLPPLGKIDIKLPEEAGKCIAYVPDKYDPRFLHSLVVVLPVPGESAEDLLKEWRPYSDETQAILLMPQSKEPRSWLPTEKKFIRKTIENLRTEYRVDPERIVISGRETSGSMAILCAFSQRDLIRGVGSFSAPVPRRTPPLINEPLERLAVWITSPAEGQVADRIKSNVKQIREVKVPVIHREVDKDDQDVDLRGEFMRWVDTLDRI